MVAYEIQRRIVNLKLALFFLIDLLKTNKNEKNIGFKSKGVSNTLFFQAFCSLDMLIFILLFLNCSLASKVQKDTVDLHLALT
jgi:hypothetical protein